MTVLKKPECSAIITMMTKGDELDGGLSSGSARKWNLPVLSLLAATTRALLPVVLGP